MVNQLLLSPAPLLQQDQEHLDVVNLISFWSLGQSKTPSQQSEMVCHETYKGVPKKNVCLCIDDEAIRLVRNR